MIIYESRQHRIQSHLKALDEQTAAMREYVRKAYNDRSSLNSQDIEKLLKDIKECGNTLDKLFLAIRPQTN